MTRTEPSTAPPQLQPRSRRAPPLGIVLLAALWLVHAGVALIGLIDPSRVPPSVAETMAARLGLGDSAVIVNIVVSVLIAIGLLLLQGWAWVASMLLIGIGLTIEVASYFSGEPHYPYLAVYAALAFYLNGPDVRRVLRLPSAPATAASASEGPDR